MKTVFILSVSSDIGIHLAERYLEQGYDVVGTYRNKSKALSSLEKHAGCTLLRCDVSKSKDIAALAKKLKAQKFTFDIFISCVGHLLPVTSFFESNFKEWAASVNVNCLAQLEALHALYPMRNKKGATVVFFAGGGMNNAVVNFSAYTASKIFLTKMCEFIDIENSDLNIFIVGPGWTKTKIHQTILDDKRTYQGKVTETKKFLQEKSGTSMDDIYECIDWLSQQSKTNVSGRNFSVVFDPWRFDQRDQLIKALAKDASMYKLRRSGNDFLQQ